MAFIVSLHLPKTAGSSLLAAYQARFGERVYDYNEAPELFDRLGVAGLRARYDVIHGHFHIRDRADLLDGARLVTYLRDPVQRVISSYYFHMRPDTDNWLAPQIQAAGLSLEDFARLPEQRNLQYRMLRPVPLERFDFIGLTERFEASIPALSAVIGAELSLGENRKVNPDKPLAAPYQSDPALAGLIRALNPRDVELYETILARGA